MSQNVIIVGASAAGPKAACRIKRMDRSATVTVIDRDKIFSYAGCGIPYFVGGDVADAESLRSTFAHVVRDCEYFGKVKSVHVKAQTEAVWIDRKVKRIKIRHLVRNQEEFLSYDKLVLATGSKPSIPPMEGVSLPGVMAIASLRDAMEIKDRVSRGLVESAVVIGGGAKGLEMAEALTDLWGVETTIVEKESQLLPNAFGSDMALLIHKHLEQSDVRVVLSGKVLRICGDAENGVEAVEIQDERIPCELVVIAAGTSPNVSLAKKAGLEIGEAGGVVVDEGLKNTGIAG